MGAGRRGSAGVLQPPTNSLHAHIGLALMHCRVRASVGRFVSAVGLGDEIRPSQAHGEASAIRALIETVKKEEVNYLCICAITSDFCILLAFKVKVHVQLHDRIQEITLAGMTPLTP